MEHLPIFLTIFLAHILLLVSPGPNVLLVAQVAASHSRKSGLLTSLGISTGSFIWALLAILGLSVIFEQVAWLYLILKYIGALYLIYLGYKCWRDAEKPLATLPSETLTRSKSVYGLGLVTNLSNPKVLIFMGSFFAAMLPAASPMWVKGGVLIMYTLTSLSFHILIAYALSTSRVQQGYNMVKAWLDRVIGAFFIVIGLKLAFSGE